MQVILLIKSLELFLHPLTCLGDEGVVLVLLSEGLTCNHLCYEARHYLIRMLQLAIEVLWQSQEVIGETDRAVLSIL